MPQVIVQQDFSPQSSEELTKHNTFIFQKHLENRNFGLKDNHPIWTTKRLTKLCLLIHETPKLQQKLFNTVRFTKAVKEILLHVLNDINDDTIMQIFWEELKLIRTTLKNEFYESLNCTYGKKHTSISKIKQDFKNVFQKNDIHFNDNQSIIENFYENVILENDNKTNVECKICYNKKVNTALIHEKHTCVICETCSLQISTTCPFCKQKVLATNKLIL